MSNLPFEERKWEEEKTREEAHRTFDISNEFHSYTNKAAIDSSSLVLRTLIVINGGAAITILAFLGDCGERKGKRRW